jgi:EAL domain-containing protein (putative c-di-GMP-specific phosphodiesterase class I)
MMGLSTSQMTQLDRGALESALVEARVQTLYQPIVRVADRCPVGLEVLARLTHPAMGTIGPDVFVPRMEAAGLGRSLFETVIARAFSDWQLAGLAVLGLTLAVNLPLDVLLLPDAAAWLEAACRAAAIPCECIVIELTEGQEISDLPSLALVVTQLRGLGFGLAIDDVGPDVRDHSPLLDLPFTKLKLDRRLVRAAAEGGASERFFRTVLAEARRAGLTVIGEGVEDTCTWSRMASNGVDQAQGYLISQPLAAADVGRWVDEWSAPGRRALS